MKAENPANNFSLHKNKEIKLAKNATASDPFLDSALDIDSDDDAILDLSEVPDSINFETWPAGVYDAVVEDVEYGRSQRSNKPMLTWHMKLTRNDGKERTMFHYSVLEGDGLPRTKRTIMRVAPDIDLREFKPSRAGELFAGKLCQVRVKIGTFEGTRRNQISDVLPAREDQQDSFLQS